MISVCIPTFNGELYIKEQLESILCQLSSTDEIVISDDTSNDNTLAIVALINDPRIKVFEKNKFYSPTYNVENALKHAKGEIIILSDQDDVWLDGRVEEIVEALKTCDLVLTNAYIVDSNLEKSNKTLFEALNTNTGIIKNILKNTYVGCCMAFKSKMKPKLLPFPSNLPMHDQWIGLIAEIFYKVKILSNPSLLYRRHHFNASVTVGKSKNPLSLQLKYRFNLISNLLKILLNK